MSLISDKDIKLLNKKFFMFGGLFNANTLLSVIGMSKINEVYNSVADIKGRDGAKAIMDKIGFTYSTNEEANSYIPKEGAFIVVANHPFGAAEGLALVHKISEIRPDTKVLVNFMLSRVANLNEFWLGVNPYEKNRDAFSSFKGLKQAFNHLKENKPIVIFPAGEVSTWQRGFSDLTDRSWNQPIMKLVQKAQVPIVPVYIGGQNCTLFHLLGKIHPLIRTAQLPRQLLNKKGKNIPIKFGPAIKVEEQNQFDYKDFVRFVRLKVYSMRLSDSIKIKRQRREGRRLAPIIPPIDKELIKKEIELLSTTSEELIITTGKYQLFITKAERIPNLLKEIGRLREITFRDVGEGSGKPFDLDKYDKDYHQMFIWDSTDETIVGGYRIGVGKELSKKEENISAFYTHSLFKINENLFEEKFNRTQEFGRSFIVKNYQRKAIPLLMLWKGLLYLMLKYDSKYAMGSVSISGDYSVGAKALIMLFIEQFCFDPDWEKSFQRRNKMPIKLPKWFDKTMFIEATQGDFDKLDSFIKGIDPTYKTPVLLRQYISMLQAKGIGFNIDPNFGDCVDVLMVLDLFNTTTKTIEMIGKDLPLQNKVEQLLDVLRYPIT